MHFILMELEIQIKNRIILYLCLLQESLNYFSFYMTNCKMLTNVSKATTMCRYRARVYIYYK